MSPSGQRGVSRRGVKDGRLSAHPSVGTKTHFSDYRVNQDLRITSGLPVNRQESGRAEVLSVIACLQQLSMQPQEASNSALQAGTKEEELARILVRSEKAYTLCYDTVSSQSTQSTAWEER